MNHDTRTIINALPLSIRSETRNYATWLEERVPKWIEDLPARLRARVTPDEFVNLAICRRVSEIPTNQLRTLRAVLSHGESHGAASIRLRYETLESDGRAIRALERLQSALTSVLEENGVAYLLEVSSPKRLLRVIAERHNALQ